MKTCVVCGKAKKNMRGRQCASCGVVNWRRRKKIMLVEMFGGQCVVCGYSRCLNALDFHHVDPATKTFSISRASIVSWDRVVEEAKKCVLVCANCHREIHSGLVTLAGDEIGSRSRLLIERPERTTVGSNPTLSASTVRTPAAIKENKPCGVCGKNTTHRRYCSSKCSSIGRRHTERPSKEELATLLGTSTMVALGKRFGVSDNAVRKWARIYGIR